MNRATIKICMSQDSLNDYLNGLSERFSRRQEAIVDEWLKICEEDHSLHVINKLTRQNFRNNIPAAIEGLCQVLNADNTDLPKVVQTAVSKHGHHRWKQGFNLKELIRDWGHLNRALTREIEDHLLEYNDCPKEWRRVVYDRLTAFITEAMTYSVARYDELRRSEAESLVSDLEVIRSEFDTATRARGELLREATHDIGGSLAAVEMTATSLKKSLHAEASLTHVMDNLDASIQSVRSMFSSLLDLARLESGQDKVNLMSVQIGEELHKLTSEFKPMADEKGLQLKVDGPRDLLVQTDPQKIRRIVQNLLLNALQQTREGSVALSWKVEEQRWSIQIQDTGPGIQNLSASSIAKEMDHPDQAEGPSHESTLSYQGEGIGLTIVKRLCEQLEGSITLESEMGRGATFIVQLPFDYDSE